MIDNELGISVTDHVATVEIQRPPNNYFDEDLINALADTFEALDDESDVRAIVLAAEGKHFCAGANFASPSRDPEKPRPTPSVEDGNPLYDAAVRLFACGKPVVGAIQGAAIGGGFGLAVMPDFRVVTPEARFAANFVKLGFHPGFGLTYTLPKLIGGQRAARMFMTGERIDGETAAAWGLADRMTSADRLRQEAQELAAEIAANAPLAIVSVRATLRQGVADAVRAATDHEHREQFRLRQTNDHKEGVKAVAERRPGNFTGT